MPKNVEVRHFSIHNGGKKNDESWRNLSKSGEICLKVTKKIAKFVEIRRKKSIFADAKNVVEKY